MNIMFIMLVATDMGMDSNADSFTVGKTNSPLIDVKSPYTGDQSLKAESTKSAGKKAETGQKPLTAH